MYAVKILKSNADLLTLLNKGVPLKEYAKNTLLMVQPDGENFVITEKEFDQEFGPKISVTSPFVMKINKR